MKIRIIAALTPTLLLCGTMANAMTLQGGIKTTNYDLSNYNRTVGDSANAQAQVTDPPHQVLIQQQAIQQQAIQQKAIQQQTHFMQAMAAQTSTMRAQALAGRWDCVTQVKASTAPGVSPGTQVRSQVAYTRDAAGRIIETCAENGWNPSKAAVVNLASDTMVVTRASSSQSRGCTIAAQAKDLMKIVSPNTLLATSRVNQFVNGRFVGQYQTESILHKID